VLDAGTTEWGRPYFVMEHVPGVPITDYCDRHRLTTRKRLELIIPVCQAIHHAHQRGIIHRDVKPSNVLVMIQDGKPVPKVIDFGVAKALNQRLTEQTLFTELGQLIGTPAYMSPEQAEMTGLNVDTTTDVYSLGVLLYELLAGALPFDATELLKAGWEALHRVLREVDPLRPSTRLSTLGDRAVAVALNRNAEPFQLERQLKGELDWIVMRAIEKDRTRRYPSASELAADIERYLTDQPVLARPPSAAYQISKLIARHRAVFGVAVMSLALLVGAVVWISLLYARADRNLSRAQRAEREASSVSDFLLDIFRVSDPYEARGSDVTARELLEKGARRTEEEVSLEPLVQARLMRTMGQAYLGLGMADSARPLLEKCLSIRRDVLGEENLDVAESWGDMGTVSWHEGAFDSAQALFRKSLEIRERLAGPDDPVVAKSLMNLALALSDGGRYEEARAHAERALAIREKTLDEKDPELAAGHNSLATILFELEDYEPARRHFEEAIRLYEKEEGAESPNVAGSLMNYASLLHTVGESESARRHYERVLSIREKTLGAAHPDFGMTLVNHAIMLIDSDRGREAIDYAKRGAAVLEAGLGPDHPFLGSALQTLAVARHKTGGLAESDSLFRRAREIFAASLPPDHPYMVENLSFHAELLREMGRKTEAAALEARLSVAGSEERE
jgi:tetratricopeptide (TPR) repeat protein